MCRWRNHNFLNVELECFKSLISDVQRTGRPINLFQGALSFFTITLEKTPQHSLKKKRFKALNPSPFQLDSFFQRKPIYLYKWWNINNEGWNRIKVNESWIWNSFQSLQAFKFVFWNQQTAENVIHQSFLRLKPPFPPLGSQEEEQNIFPKTSFHLQDHKRKTDFVLVITNPEILYPKSKIRNPKSSFHQDQKRKTDFVLVFEEDKKDAQLCQLPTVLCPHLLYDWLNCIVPKYQSLGVMMRGLWLFFL